MSNALLPHWYFVLHNIMPPLSIQIYKHYMFNVPAKKEMGDTKHRVWFR
jgi:hypothetical protein